MATKSSKIHVYIFMALIFFLCLLAFSVGTFVGKSVTESEMKRNQTQVFNNMNDRAVAAAAEEEPFDETAEAIATDEETLSKEETDALAEEFDTKKEENPEPSLDEEPEDKVSANTTIEKSAIDDVTQRIAQDEAPTDKFKEPRKPASILPSGATLGKYTVQLASYTDEKEAQKHAEKLKSQGYSAFFITAKVRGREWYRVSVGLFEDSKKANTFRKGFVQKTNLEASIVQKITQ